MEDWNVALIKIVIFGHFSWDLLASNVGNNSLMHLLEDDRILEVQGTWWCTGITERSVPHFVLDLFVSDFFKKNVGIERANAKNICDWIW